MSELSGQVAIVTGGASGIGAATVALLAEAGASVVAADIQPAAQDAPGRFVKHDVASEDSWKALLADVLARDSRLDILVNNAGITGGWGTVESTTVEQWRRVEAVDSEGVFLGCKYAIEGMKRTGPDKPASGGRS
jgi:3(or 17)beta-hydroxysteroid dehydrogenase